MKIRILHTTLLLFALCTLNFELHGQYFSIGTDPATVHWNVIKTEHFRTIYPATDDSLGLHVANTLEYFREPGAASLNALPNHWPIILHNESVISNAYTPYAPKRIEMITTPPQDNYPQNWMDQLVMHEFRHSVQYTSLNRGLTKALGYLFGQQAVPAVMGLFVPFWFIEGDAVVTETANSETGRGRVPSFNMKLRAQFLQKGIYSYDKAVNGSFRDFTANHYELGYQLVGRTRVEYGRETWSKVMKKTGEIPVMLVPFSNTLYKQTGFGKSRLYGHITGEMAGDWISEDKDLHWSVYTPLNEWKDKSYTSRTQPVAVNGNSVVTRRTSMDDIPRLVAIRPSGMEHVVASPGSMTDDNLSASENLVCWAELDRDPRWSLRNYSVIMLHDLSTGKTRQLTHRSRYFSPDIGRDKRKIVAVEVDESNYCYLVVINVITSNVEFRFPAPDGIFLSYPAWSPDRGEIAVIVTQDEGKSLAVVDAVSGEFTLLLPFSTVEISKPAFYGNYILFTGGYNGTDNIYAIDPGSRKIYRVTSSRFGATDASISEDGSTLYFSDYSADGFIASSTPMDPSAWIPYDTALNYKWDLADRLSSQENFRFNAMQVPDSAYTIKPYRKGLNLFNFHSWAPLSVDASNMTVNPGVMLLSQNLLGTSYTTLGYSYDMNEEVGNYYVKYSYEGWYPVLDLQADYGLQRAVYYDSTEAISYKYNQLNLAAGLRIPLNWNIRSWYAGLQPYAGYSLKFLEMVQGNGLKFSHPRINSLDYSLFLYAQSRMSDRDLQPKWGQQVQLDLRHTPFGADTANRIFAAQAVVYLPGFHKHHGFKLYGGYQNRYVEYYKYSSIVPVPRGYSGIYSNDYFTGQVSYVMPVCYPDWNLGPVLYLKRVNAAVFYDFMFAMDYSPSTYYQSCGLDLTFDFHLFRLFVPFEAGLRTIWLPDQGSFQFEFLYSVNLNSLY